MEGVSKSMVIVSEFIAKDEKLIKEELCSWHPSFGIADFGCSTGPNTFMVAQFVVECMHLKYNSHGLPPPDFHVFFYDLAANEFNTLFHSLATVSGGHLYFPAGFPGSFYGRLFPEGSLHFGFSSYTLHWLTQVPVEVKDRSSLAWNKGRIYLIGALAAAARAYAEQFAEDVSKFLNARVVEMVT